MLIRDSQQPGAEKLLRGQLCGSCHHELTYPVIVAMDRNRTAHHAACALALAREVMTDLQGLVGPSGQGGKLAGLALAFSQEEAHKP